MQQKTTNILSQNTTLQNGKYQIEELLGQGGFGITYKATQTMLGVPFAIKEFFVNTQNYYSHRDTTQSNLVKPQFDKALFDKLREGFVNEARTLFQLDKIPHIVQIRDMFEENDTVYIVMDYVEGKSLQQIVEDKGIISEKLVKDYARQLLTALDKVHAKNVLHRDIKPANILVTPNNEVVLIDFGIARSFIQDQTQMHTVMLSKGFSPPEQEVEKARKGSFSDIYSLGATLYYCLTGQPPQTLSDLTFEDYVSAKDLNSKVSEGFSQFIDKAIQKKPSDRFQNCKEFSIQINNQPPVPRSDNKVKSNVDPEKTIIEPIKEKKNIAKIVKSVQDPKRGNIKSDSDHTIIEPSNTEKKQKVLLENPIQQRTKLHSFNAVRIFNFKSHPATFNIYNNGIEFIDHKDSQYSFSINEKKLKNAKIRVAWFDEIRFTLKNGSKYNGASFSSPEETKIFLKTLKKVFNLQQLI